MVMSMREAPEWMTPPRRKPLWQIWMQITGTSFVVLMLWVTYGKRPVPDQSVADLWGGVFLGAALFGALITGFVHKHRGPFTPAQRMAIMAILDEPGAIGAVLVDVEGQPVVGAVVHSVEEYEEIKGELPPLHMLYLPPEMVEEAKARLR